MVAPKRILFDLILLVSITSALVTLYSSSSILPSIKDCCSFAAWYSAFSDRSPCSLASAIAFIIFGLSSDFSFFNSSSSIE